MESALVEIAKMGLQIWFANMRMAGKSEEEIDKLYDSERGEFDRNKPDYLPDV